MTITPVICILTLAALASWLKQRAQANSHKRIMDRLMDASTTTAHG